MSNDQPGSYGKWLREAMDKADKRPAELEYESGVTTAQIYNILSGRTENPQRSTREKLEKALSSTPAKEVTEIIENETRIEGLSPLEEFDPHLSDDVPAHTGVYVLYDKFDRPVYVGKAVKQTIQRRMDQHREKFWFRSPIVERARYIKSDNAVLCGQLEMVLIRFLGSHNFLNKRGVEAPTSVDSSEDT